MLVAAEDSQCHRSCLSLSQLVDQTLTHDTEEQILLLEK